MSAPITVPPEVRYSLAFMSTHLGASQWAAACGLDPYMEPVELFERFVGLRPWEDLSGDPTVRLGHLLEDDVADETAARLGLVASPCPTLVHPDFPWLHATPDRRFVGARLLNECKVVGLCTPFSTLTDQWGEEGTDEIPMRTIAQAMGQMFVARAALPDDRPEAVIVSALIAGRGIRLYRIAWDEVLARSLFNRVTKFWSRVKLHQPPPARGEAQAAYLRHTHPAHKKGVWERATPEAIAEIERFVEAKRVEREAHERALDIANALKERIAKAEGLEVRTADGKLRARVPWHRRAGKSTVDYERIARTYHAFVAQLAQMARAARIPGPTIPTWAEVVKLNTTKGEPTDKFGPVKFYDDDSSNDEGGEQPREDDNGGN